MKRFSVRASRVACSGAILLAVAGCSRPFEQLTAGLLALDGATTIEFSAIHVGDTADLQAVVKNSGQTKAATMVGTIDSADFSFAGGSYPGTSGTCGVELAPAATCTVVIHYAPTTAGTATAVLTLGYNDGAKIAASLIDITGTATTNPGTTATHASRYDFAVDAVGASLIVQSDHKILLTGTEYPTSGVDRVAVIRTSADLNLDSTFGTGGRLSTSPSALLDNAGTAIGLAAGDVPVIGGIAGTVGAVLKTTTGGILDSLFGLLGNVLLGTFQLLSTDKLMDLQVLGTGKIIITGTTKTAVGVAKAFVARLNSDGNLDTTFGTLGSTVFSLVPGDTTDIRKVVTDASGKILVVGSSLPTGGTTDSVVARLSSSGVLDGTFGTGGIAKADRCGAGYDDVATGIAVQSNGKLVIAGFCSDGTKRIPTAWRLNTDGTLDAGFGASGKTQVFATDPGEFNDVKLYADGHVALGGYSNDGTNEQFLVAFRQYRRAR